MQNLKDLYIHELRDIYNAETQIINALPKMAEAATHGKLKSAFEEHLQVTKEQKNRLDKIFKGLNESPTGEKCEGMEGLINESEELLHNDAASSVLDAALISAAQRVEHYEMAAYGTARTLAEKLGRNDDAELLQQTLDEEGETDHELTDISTRVIIPEMSS